MEKDKHYRMKDLVIVGAGDFGREMANVVERINSISSTWNLMGFVDDNPDIQGKEIDTYPVVGTIDWLNSIDKEIWAICSLGVAQSRKNVVSRIDNKNVRFASLVDPDARLYRDAEIGYGSIICGGSIAEINTKIGNHVVINLNSTLGHDDVIGDFCVVNPGVNISGKVVLGECSDVGTGGRILQGLKIHPNTVIGAGGVVIKDITEPGTYVGVPVKKVK